jgi:hypothetical protein
MLTMAVIVVLAVIVIIVVRMGGGRLDGDHGGRRRAAAHQADGQQAETGKAADTANQPTTSGAPFTVHRRRHHASPGEGVRRGSEKDHAHEYTRASMSIALTTAQR